MNLPATTSQTVGPYLHIGLTRMLIENLAPAGATGERVAIEGRIVDGDGKPVNDALVEIWQANAEGAFSTNVGADGFRGFGRSATDDEGRFRFQTIKPGRVSGPGGNLQAPHIAVNVFMRGLLKQLVTRIYFPDEPANAGDAVLALVPAERRGTLIAKKLAGKPGTLEWNVILQGRDETVFFDC
jgi:protocatechuate 3,4-dioxygenase alpha subunit